MSEVEEITMDDSPQSKLDSVLRAIEALTVRTGEMENFVSRLSHSQGANIPQLPPQEVIPEPTTTPPVQENIKPTSTQNVTNIKEPRISLPEKFDGTRSKFRGFVNQVRLVTFLQPQRYSTEELRVGLVGTLLTGQALSWFAPLFEKRSPILSNFETFLNVFAEAFGEHDKVRWATTRIRSLHQGSRSTSIYASDFRQIACDINWGEEALMSQFYWGLRDEVKDLLLSLPDPQTLNEAISQAVKCDNRLFQRRQDQRSRTLPKQYIASSYPTASTTIVDSGPEDMQIDAARFKRLTPQEKKRRMDENLCLYCGEPGHKAINCTKKLNRQTFKTRSATTLENDEVQLQ